MWLDLLDAARSAGLLSDEHAADLGGWVARAEAGWGAAEGPSARVRAGLDRAFALAMTGSVGRAERALGELSEYQNNETQDISLLGAALISRLRFGLCASGRATRCLDGPDAGEILSAALPRLDEANPSASAAALLNLNLVPVLLANASVPTGLTAAGSAGDRDPPGWVQALSAPDPLFRASAARRLARIRQVSGDLSGAVALLERAAADSLGAGDALSAALAHLMAGDALAGAAPWWTGGVWPHPCERGAMDLSPDRVDAPASRDLSAAAAAWARAEANSEIPWISAHIAARRASLEEPPRAASWARAADLFTSAGDATGQAISTLWAELARIGSGAPPQRALAATLGAWGAGEGSASVAVGLALTALAWGWRQAEVQGEVWAAERAAQLSAWILEDLDAPRTLGQALLGLAQLSRRARGDAAAWPALEQAWALGARLEAEGDAMGRALRWSALITQIQLARRPTAIEALVVRIEALIAEARPEDAPYVQLLRAAGALDLGRMAALARARDAAAEGDEAALADALCVVEQGLDALPETAAAIWGATAAVFREDWEAARQRTLAYLDLAAPEAALAVEGLDPGGQQALHAAQRALDDTGRQNRMIEALNMLVGCRAWRDAAGLMARLEAELGPAGWASASRPWDAWLNRAEVLEGLGDLEGAAEAAAEAWKIAEQRRAGITGDEGRSALSRETDLLALGRVGGRAALGRAAMAEAAGQTGRAAALRAEAFSWSEASRSRALAELLLSSRSPLAEGAPTELVAWRACRARVAALQEALQGASHGRSSEILERINAEQAALPALEAALATRSPRMMSLLRPDLRALPLDEVPAHLPPDSAYLSVGYGSDQLELWWVPSRGAPRWPVIRARGRQLAALARRFTRAAALGDDGREAGEALAALLLAPLGDALGMVHQLLIAPQGVLHTLPWAALPWRGAHLGDAVAITLVPNAASLALRRPAAYLAPLDRALVLGDPARMSWIDERGATRTLPSLPAAADEARRIAARFQAPTLLIGEAATRAAMLDALPGARWIHLATHGRSRPDRPLDSAVLLADGEALTVAEWMGLTLSAELAVLSACDTGQGEIVGGAEVLGLSRGLLAAGAGAVLVSLWPVNDRATRLLMDGFYGALAAGLSPPFALKRASHELRALAAEDPAPAAPSRDLLLGRARRAVGYDHPTLWAPFVLLG